MESINVLLLCGGGGSEHDVSITSANFVAEQLARLPHVRTFHVELKKEGGWYSLQGEKCQLNQDKTLSIGSKTVALDYAIPCIHGFPGETGDIQSLFELIELPYLGCGSQASILCFNKVSSKLWFDALAIPNTPYCFITQNDEQSRKLAHAALEKWQTVFVKAACQGSSVGCYKVADKAALDTAIDKAFSFSEQVLIEKALQPRELEIAAYHYDGQVVVTKPGEVICAKDTFYSFDEKYSAASLSTTTLTPSQLTDAQIEQMQQYAKKAFVQMKLKDLSRIDFFLTQDGEILLNEINTFPGMTPISMFPKLMQHHGHDFAQYLAKCISQATQKAPI
ncbi:MAG: D-alanine--D-alanine ligase [Enterovibrio sp.]